jgi:hypothetical protein
MLVLAPGGRLAFFGPPGEACRWFEVSTPDAVFNRFGSKEPAAWAEEYRLSPSARKYVDTREHLLSLTGMVSAAEDDMVRPKRSQFTHAAAQLARYTKVKLRDQTGMAVLAAQPPLLALVMWIVFPKPTTALMFMVGLSCLWFGMSASVRELITDRVIWLRERRVGVGVGPYLFSKVVVLGVLSTLQCVVFSGLLYWALGMSDYGYDLVRLASVGMLTGLVGMSLGLLVSGCWTSSEGRGWDSPALADSTDHVFIDHGECSVHGRVGAGV